MILDHFPNVMIWIWILVSVRLCNFFDVGSYISSWIFGQISTELNEIIVFCKYHRLQLVCCFRTLYINTRVLNKSTGRLLDNEEKYSCTYTFCHLINKKIPPIFPFFHLTNFKKVQIYTFICNFGTLEKLCKQVQEPNYGPKVSKSRMEVLTL